MTLGNDEENTKSKSRIKGKCSEGFITIGTGLRQGDSFLTLFFTLLLAKVIRHSQLNRGHSLKVPKK